ncbi:MAG: ABC transporter substrate-binding protein [Acidimicrobiia bacterium]
MKKATRIFILVLAIALVATACSSGEESLEGRTVTVGVENLYPPFNYIDEATGEGAGFDYDIWREICSRLDCSAEFAEAGWPAVIEETGQGVYDTAADGISITEERKAIVAFSDPYMSTIQKFMVRADEGRFTTSDEFIAGDYIVATQVGTTNFELAEKLIGAARIEAFDNFSFAVQALLSGDVDAVIIDDVAGQGYQGANAGEMKNLEGDLQSDPLGFIYPHESDLIEPVNKVIEDMLEDGTMDALIKKWFIDFEA